MIFSSPAELHCCISRCLTVHRLHALQTASEDAASSVQGVSSEAAAADTADTPWSGLQGYAGLNTPLLHKKSGFRESGFVFAPRKSWWAGLVIVVVSVLVMLVTLLTANT